MISITDSQLVAVLAAIIMAGTGVSTKDAVNDAFRILKVAREKLP